MVDKIKQFIEEIKETIQWIGAGCPQPQKVRSKERKNEKIHTKGR